MPVGFDSIRAGASGSADAYEIDYACRFNDNDSAYLTRTPGAGNRKTWTWSGWVKRANLNTTNPHLFSAGTANGNRFSLRLVTTTNNIWMFHYNGATFSPSLQSTAVYRDPAAWMHVHTVYDSTPGSPGASDIYTEINGVKITDFGIEVYPAQNFETVVNEAIAHSIGRLEFGSQYGRY